MKLLLQRYPTTIWIRVLGTVLTKTCDFMVRSFVGIYLYEKMGQNILTSASVTVAGPACALLVTTFTGGWSDRVGRKPVMVFSIVVQGLSVLGYLFAKDYSHFLLLSLFMGFANAFYWPAAQAQVADLIPHEKRGEVFALMHVALNVGAAIGPMIGVMIYKSSPEIAFMASSAGLMFFALLLLFFTVESAPVKVGGEISNEEVEEKEKTSWFQFISKHRMVYYIMLATIPVGLLYSQVELILPLQLRTRFSDYLTVFGMLMSINGACVTLLQLPVQKWIQKFNIARTIALAYVFMAVTSLGYGWFGWVPLIIFAEVCFVFGEITAGPQVQKVVAQIAPPELRGKYFSIHALNWGISGVVGPIVGALGMKYLGGNWWFTVLAGIVLIAGYFQYRLTRRTIEE